LGSQVNRKLDIMQSALSDAEYDKEMLFLGMWMNEGPRGQYEESSEAHLVDELKLGYRGCHYCEALLLKELPSFEDNLGTLFCDTGCAELFYAQHKMVKVVA
jgi:hypothetical protein